MELKEFTKEDFLESIEPFEYLYSFKDDTFMLEKMLLSMSIMAQKHGIRNFKKLFTEYCKMQKQQANTIFSNSVTQFEGQPLELNCGAYRADEYGITCDGMFGEIVVCRHPLLPVERLVNIDTGVEKLKLAFRKGKQWRSVISNKKTLASSNSILDLADSGIAVNSENSKHIVKYLHDIEHDNYNVIPEKNSVSRLGWIENEGFSPYCGSLTFDGESSYRKAFESVKSCGSYEKWIDVARRGRAKNTVTKIILAASFASVLVQPIGCLPFFVHLWGTTEVGKTVGLMIAASVWANPEIGKYVQNFNSTNVGRERTAAFFNNMPLIMDEFQIEKDKKNFDHAIYTLCEGAGKSRGNKNGGIDQTPTWSLCVLSSGEHPLTNANSGGGAVNRIIDISSNQALFDDPQEVCSVIRKNHGILGPMWIDYLQKESTIDEINLLYKKHYSKLSEHDTTQKQSMAAALILATDEVISKLYFHDEPLTACDIKDYLQSKKDVSSNERGYRFLCDWVSQNSFKFQHNDNTEVFGKIEDDHVYIINTVFNKVLQDNGYNSTALINWMKEKRLIKVGDKTTVTVRINKISTRCVCMLMVDDGSLDCPF